MRKVPFFNYPYVYTNDKDSYLKVIDDVCSRGAFIMQKDLQEFEQRIADYCGVKYAVGVANATDGLQIGMMAGGIGPGDEVIVCSHTMIATASAVHFAGATPVPVEVGPDRNIDVASIEAAITDKTKAICPTQLNGRVANMDAIEAIAKKHNLQVYEDAAQALGAEFKGKKAGSFGVAACFSFYPAKILGCFGDGGIVTTNDEKVYDKMLLLRDHGRSHKTGEVECWGYNTRLDNLQAAILNYNFDTYEDVIKRRRQMAGLYQERLGGLSQVQLPPPPVDGGDYFDVYQNYEISADRRDELKAFLAEKGVGTLMQWGGTAVHQFPKLGFKQSLPKTDEFFKKMIMIPLNMSMTDDDVHYVCDQITSFYKA
ncbi:MAG: DegT/DnrJ/EryC1/StrS family aminotransferase [Bdellovibrionales bacterium]|nr:DegT/DnrJ/EryC1/StrS family aminotransferase [Bdellovibrionales bacterium]